jgi:hypothetical protein
MTEPMREIKANGEGNLKLLQAHQRLKPVFSFPNDATGSAAAPCEHPLLKD